MAQLPPIPTTSFSLTMPKHTSKACQALTDLMGAPITQPGWLLIGRGWRLAAAINRLLDLGWPISNCWVIPMHHQNPIKRYWLEAEDKRLARIRMKELRPC
jgi:hypothetical protein